VGKNLHGGSPHRGASGEPCGNIEYTQTAEKNDPKIRVFRPMLPLQLKMGETKSNDDG
jgi:hypothetical protein